MALFGNVSEEYTKTGKGTLAGWADTLSYVPVLGGILAFPLGMISTVIEAGKWAFQGKLGSAATVLAAGTVGSAVDSLTAFGNPLNIATGGLTWWAGNAASGMTTGANFGTHARAATESIIGALGLHPEVLNSYPAAIGSLSQSAYMGGKDNFRDKIAAERGLTRQQMDARADQAYVNLAQGNNQLGA